MNTAFGTRQDTPPCVYTSVLCGQPAQEGEVHRMRVHAFRLRRQPLHYGTRCLRATNIAAVVLRAVTAFHTGWFRRRCSLKEIDLYKDNFTHIKYSIISIFLHFPPLTFIEYPNGK